jgi:hypothetical protein
LVFGCKCEEDLHRGEGHGGPKGMGIIGALFVSLLL